MKVVESNIEEYSSNLKALIKELNPTYVLGGYMAVKTIAEDKLLKENRVLHTSVFDDRVLSIGISSNNLPLTSYNCILFDKLKVIGQIYLDSKLIWEQFKLKESNVSN